jgi:hypothetical protein
VDIEHFQIIVNAMLSWQNETRPPKKSPSRPAMVAAAAPRDELDDDEEYVDEEEFEPEESLNIEPDAPAVVEAEAEADLLDADADLPD